MIPLIYTWARSGATLLNKCLSAMGHIVLSEAHPTINSGVHAPRWQGINWFGANIPIGTPWLECVVRLKQLAAERGKSLIIRDWTVNSFYPSEANDMAPIRRLYTHKVLGTDCIPVAFVRDAIDCALSFAKFHGWRTPKLLDAYANAYLRYVDQIIDLDCHIFRYEMLCKNPQAFLQGFCDVIGVEYSNDWNNFHHIKDVHGDTFSDRSRGSTANRIRMLPRRRNENLVTGRIMMSHHLRSANKRLARVYAK